MPSNAAHDAAKRSVALLKEYCQKIEARLAELKHARKSMDHDPGPYHIELMELVGWRDGMAKPLSVLAQQASQLVEFTAPDDAARMELKIRLAELETLVRQLREV